MPAPHFFPLARARMLRAVCPPADHRASGHAAPAQRVARGLAPVGRALASAAGARRAGPGLLPRLESSHVEPPRQTRADACLCPACPCRALARLCPALAHPRDARSRSHIDLKLARSARKCVT